MPEYIYEHPESGEQITVWQSIQEEHVYKVDDDIYNGGWLSLHFFIFLYLLF